MTLDDLLKERNCQVTFERVDMGNYMGIEATIITKSEVSRKVQEGVFVSSGSVYVSARGRDVSESFAEAVKRLIAFEKIP